MNLTWVLRPADPELPSGGDRYDAAAVAQWRSAGAHVSVLALPGAWPDPTPEDRRRLAGRLDEVGAEPVIIDGLLGGVCPEVVEVSARRRPTVLLVHLPLPIEAAGGRGEELARLERAAAAAAHVVVTTSRWAASDVRSRYPDTSPVMVAAPGVEAAPVSAGSAGDDGVPQLLALGSLTRRKGLLVLIEALGSLTAHRWRAVIVGPAHDHDHAAELREAARRHGIADRVRWTGALGGAELEHVWDRSDLLVHPSRAETFGMVVTEAQARGIPAVVVRGTGAQEALADGGGSAVGPLAADLAATLHSWLDDPALRERWRREALARRRALPGWSTTVRALTAAVDRAREVAA